MRWETPNHTRLYTMECLNAGRCVPQQHGRDSCPRCRQHLLVKYFPNFLKLKARQTRPMENYEEYDDDQTADDYVEFGLLTRFWRNERCAPTLFPYQERLMDHTKEKGWANHII